MKAAAFSYHAAALRLSRPGVYLVVGMCRRRGAIFDRVRHAAALSCCRECLALIDEHHDAGREPLAVFVGREAKMAIGLFSRPGKLGAALERSNWRAHELIAFVRDEEIVARRRKR